MSSRQGLRRLCSSRCFQSCNRHGLSTFSRLHQHQNIKQAEVDTDILCEPTWSVRSLLPSETTASTSKQEVTSKQLHHLLCLSALPPPKDEAEEAQMLATLSSQLHFVKAIQDIDTTGVKPLQSLRDETNVGRKEAELSLAALSDALSEEEVVGKHHKRIRRRKDIDSKDQHEAWDVLGSAEKKVGRFFVVEGGKD